MSAMASSVANHSARARPGAPVLIDALGSIERRVTSLVELGDHPIVVGEIVEAHLNKPTGGR
jgi:flavin reductase (DIM6/NTAB) family NADH-FMN oxidoreductase RutF